MLNPIAFRPGPVTFWTTVVYLSLLIPLVVINETVPPVAKNAATAAYNLTEAWLDLTKLTSQYHPYNSHDNDDLRNWLLYRVHQILDANGVSWSTETPEFHTRPRSSLSTAFNVSVFNDLTSNITFKPWEVSARSARSATGVSATYFEGTNIIVYIRGKQDEEGPWWRPRTPQQGGRLSQGGTMVNAHYDSVSTGYGATDNGMGVVSVLQLIKYFTMPGNQPQRGIVVLLNNGEEDGLHGAYAFGQSPLLPFVRTFLNLEGAGAGGRAVLFRTTDYQVTASYAGTSDPFGSVMSSDLFGLGTVKSGTDYTPFTESYGQRGLDLAFFKPRARYHTAEDDAKHASRASLWHMMSAALHTMINLSADTGEMFEGARPDGVRSKVPNGKPSDGVWLDVFGKGLLLFTLRAMFAWSLTILIAAPLFLLLVTYALHKLNKYYFLTASVRTYDQPDYEFVTIGGWRGFFRFPLAVVVSEALVVGVAFLVETVNPFVIYANEYAVWAMMLSLFYFSFWAIMRAMDTIRPSALHRGFVHMWLFVAGWATLVAATVLEDRFHISAVYVFVFFESVVFLSTLISLLELFALPKKRDYGRNVREEHAAVDHYRVVSQAEHGPAATTGEAATNGVGGDGEEDEVGAGGAATTTEATPLLAGDATNDGFGTTFATTYRRSISALAHGARTLKKDGGRPWGREQVWSGHLPSSLWWLQFLLLGPLMIVLSAQIGLLLVDAVKQTGTDGSNLLLPYLIMSIATLLVLLPMTPFFHRVSHHIPLFLLVVFVGTLMYNLCVFPFSSSTRYKAFFQQTVNLDTGTTTVHVHGVEEYIRLMIADLPSAAGTQVTCRDSVARRGLAECTFDGAAVAPRLGRNLGDDTVPPEKRYAGLVQFNVSRGVDNSATFHIDAYNTKACYLKFDKPVSAASVRGSSGWDDRFGAFPDDGVGMLKLWRRDWKTPWVVDVEWVDDPVLLVSDDASEQDAQPDAHGDGDELRKRTTGLEGHVVCKWDDINTKGVIPAFEEALMFAPAWSTWTKTADGLVEGWTAFRV